MKTFLSVMFGALSIIGTDDFGRRDAQPVTIKLMRSSGLTELASAGRKLFFSGGDPRIEPARRRQRAFGAHIGEGIEPRIACGDAGEAFAGDLERAALAGADGVRDLGGVHGVKVPAGSISSGSVKAATSAAKARKRATTAITSGSRSAEMGIPCSSAAART